MATRSPNENLGGGVEPGGKKLNRKLAVNHTKVQPTAKCSMSKYAKPYKTSAPHLTNSIMYVGQYFL